MKEVLWLFLYCVLFNVFSDFLDFWLGIYIVGENRLNVLVGWGVNNFNVFGGVIIFFVVVLCYRSYKLCVVINELLVFFIIFDL